MPKRKILVGSYVYLPLPGIQSCSLGVCVRVVLLYSTPCEECVAVGDRYYDPVSGESGDLSSHSHIVVRHASYLTGYGLEDCQQVVAIFSRSMISPTKPSPSIVRLARYAGV